MRKRAAHLLGRRAGRDALDRLLGAVQAGESRVLIVRGGPGIGKTTLLEYLARRASGCRVGTAARCPVGDGAGIRR